MERIDQTNAVSQSLMHCYVKAFWLTETISNRVRTEQTLSLNENAKHFEIMDKVDQLLVWLVKSGKL